MRYLANYWLNIMRTYKMHKNSYYVLWMTQPRHTKTQLSICKTDCYTELWRTMLDGVDCFLGFFFQMGIIEQAYENKSDISMPTAQGLTSVTLYETTRLSTGDNLINHLIFTVLTNSSISC